MTKKKKQQPFLITGELNAGFGWLFREKTFKAKTKTEAKKKAKEHWRKAPMFHKAKIKIGSIQVL